MKLTPKQILLTIAITTLLITGIVFAQNKFGEPKTVIHVVTIKWKATATPEQKQAAIDGVKALAGKVTGIKNIWLKTEKVQGMDAVVVMEFESVAALKAYTDMPAKDANSAKKQWYDVYQIARESSLTHDITN